jgi:prephenate dehydrogenase
MSSADPDFAIVGLGLIGGSIARDLAALGATVAAFDADPATLDDACTAGVVRRPLPASLAGAGCARAVVIAVPVTAAPGVLLGLRSQLRTDTLVTDVGSTKQSIEHAALRQGMGEQFVGSHPLAGDHRAGWSASRPGLFRSTRAFVCPSPRARNDVVQAALDLWRTLGAQPTLTTAAEHDRQLAWTSHLPQSVAYLLAAAIARSRADRDWLGPGGRDTMRLAASPPELWTGIALDNAAALGHALAAFRRCTADLEQALADGDEARVRELFDTARQWYCGG